MRVFCSLFLLWLTMPIGPALAMQRLTVDGVLEMAAAGVSDGAIIAMIRKEGRAFDLTPGDMIRLKKAKVSDAIVEAMLNPKAEAKAPAAEHAGPAPEASRPATVAEAPPATTATPNRASPTATGRLRKFLDRTKRTLEDAEAGPGQGGPKALDTTGLRNILPQFDSGKPLGQQFPHVAVTVLKAPPMWADTYLTTVGRGTGLFTGCFTLKTVVWSDAQHSKTVGPFDWCSPRDVQIQLGPMYMLSNRPPIKERFSGYLTGSDRTDGPRAPDALLPTDNETQQLEMKNNPKRAAFDLNMENATRLALMFANLRHGMGQTLSDNGDFRVWLVRICQ